MFQLLRDALGFSCVFFTFHDSGLRALRCGECRGAQCDLGKLRLAVGNHRRLRDQIQHWVGFYKLKSKRTMFVTEIIFDHSKGD